MYAESLDGEASLRGVEGLVLIVTEMVPVKGVGLLRPESLQNPGFDIFATCVRCSVNMGDESYFIPTLISDFGMNMSVDYTRFLIKENIGDANSHKFVTEHSCKVELA